MLVPKNNMLSSYDVLDLSILNHLQYYFDFIILSIYWYNHGVIHGVMIFQHSHGIVPYHTRRIMHCLATQHLLSEFLAIKSPHRSCQKNHDSTTPSKMD